MKADRGKRELDAREAAEKKLELLAAAVAQSSEGIAVVDLEGHVLFANHAFANMHGYEEEEIIGKHLSVFHTSEQMPAVEAATRQISEAGEFRGEIWHTRRDGTAFPTFMHNTLLRDDTGSPIAMVGTLRDITEQRLAEEALKQSEIRYRTLFRQAADAIVLIDAETGTLVEFNDRAHENLGYTREEFRNLKIAEFEVLESHEQVVEHVAKIVREGADTFETKHSTKTGEIRDVLVRSRALSLAGRSFIQSIWRDVTERRRAQEKLRLNEEMLRLVLNATSDMVSLTDVEGTVLAANEAAALSLGTKLDELIGKNAFDFFPPDVARSRKEQGDNVFRSGEPVRFQDERGGRAFDCRLYPIHEAHGNVHLIAGFVSDITELSRAGSALEESEQRYRAVFEGSVEGIIIADLETRAFKYANHAACRMFGYTQQELAQLSVLDIHPNQDRDRVLSVFEAQGRGEVQTAPGLPCLRKDGTVFYADVTAGRVIIDGRGCNVGFFNDVTERLRAEDDLRKFKTIADQASYGAAVSDLEGNLLYLNNALARMHGGSPEDFIGRSLSVFHNQEQMPRVDAFNEQLRRDGQWVAQEVWHVRRDGTAFPTLMNATVVTDAHGRPAFLSATAIDITERKQAEEERAQLEDQLRHSQKMDAVGQLAAGVAHEFNNLLVGIIGNAELVTRSIDRLPEGVRKPLEDIRRSGERAAALTQQLLAFSRKKVSKVTVFDVNRVLDQTENMLRRVIGPDITMSVARGASPCFIRADEAELDQTLTNLVINARDAMPAGGMVTIRVANVTIDGARASKSPRLSPGPYVELSVSDTGCGMTAETVERIFEPFFTTKPEGRGAGLGLSTVFANVKRATGQITVRSQPGGGTVFRVYFPRADGEIDAAGDRADLPADSAPGGSETILVCDDEDVVLRSLCWLLESGGYSVIAAESGRRALELASSHEGPIPLLLTDVIMPEMNGRELAEEITRLRPETRVVYMSGYASDVLEASGAESEDFEFLQKPSTSDAVFRCVRQVIDRPTRNGP